MRKSSFADYLERGKEKVIQVDNTGGHKVVEVIKDSKEDIYKEIDALKDDRYAVEVKTLEEIQNLHLHDFGIYLEVEPDEEAKASLEQNIQVALQQQSISLPDAIEIREIKETLNPQHFCVECKHCKKQFNSEKNYRRHIKICKMKIKN